MNIKVESCAEDGSSSALLEIKPVRSFGEVYLIRNSLDGMQYVGQTTRTIAARWKQHLAYARGNPRYSYIDRAIKKYGHEHFTIELLGVALDRLSLNKLEEWWIDTLGTMIPNGYNLKKNAKGQSGWSHSSEAREKMRDSHLGVKLSDEHRKSLSQAASKTANRRGTRGSNRKLTDEQVQDICQDSRSQKVIAIDYGVSQGCISLIKSGLTYVN